LNKNITSAVLVSGSVNVNVIGQYTIYRVKDDLNNESFVTRTVNVVPNQKTGNHSCGEHKRKQCCNILWGQQ
jgi:hypothetical protein